MHAYNAQGSYDYYNNELEGELDAQGARFRPESLETLVELTKFNRRELKLIYRGFKQLCPLGVVKEDKFKLIYAQFFPKYADTSSYARYVFNSFDTQRRQEITFTDFVIRLSILTRGSTEDKLRWIFTLYDLNGDGQITRDEFIKVASSIHHLVGKYNPIGSSCLASNSIAKPESQLSRDPVLVAKNASTKTSTANLTPNLEDELLGKQQILEIDSLFRKFDLNQDGVITMDEFMESCRKDANIMKSISVFNTIL